MIRKFILTAAALVGLTAPAIADPLAKDIFGYTPGPTAAPGVAIGTYNKGCVSGAVQLPETGPTWQAMRLSRNRNWAHPEMVNFVIGLSQAATKMGFRGLYIGDMSQMRGGPMLSGHASHQLGLDADIWMLPPSRLNLSRSERENISSISVVAGNGLSVNGNWTGSHSAIIQSAAMDPRVDRIFLDAAIKVAMCDQNRDRGAWLQKLRPTPNHDYHFHVRRTALPAARVAAIPPPLPPRFRAMTMAAAPRGKSFATEPTPRHDRKARRIPTIATPGASG